MDNLKLLNVQIEFVCCYCKIQPVYLLETSKTTYADTRSHK